LTKQAANLINSIVHFVMTPANKLSETAQWKRKAALKKCALPYYPDIIIECIKMGGKIL